MKNVETSEFGLDYTGPMNKKRASCCVDGSVAIAPHDFWMDYDEILECDDAIREITKWSVGEINAHIDKYGGQRFKVNQVREMVIESVKWGIKND